MKYLIGIGNYSMFDDGIGIRVIEYISEYHLDDTSSYKVIEVGGNLLNLLYYFTSDVEAILFVDTIKDHSYPGDYIFFNPKQVLSIKEMHNISSHEGDLMKVIEFAKETGHPIPRITVMGIGPYEIKNEIGLSNLMESHLRHYAHVAVMKMASI